MRYALLFAIVLSACSTLTLGRPTASPAVPAQAPAVEAYPASPAGGGFVGPRTAANVSSLADETSLHWTGTKLAIKSPGTVLPLAGGTMAQDAVVTFPANSVSGNAVEAVTAHDATAPKFYFRSGGATLNGAFDHVFSMGMNIAADGTPVDATRGTVAMNMESYFAPEDSDDQEWHVIFGTKDGLTQTRILSADADQTTGYANLAVTGVQFDVVDQTGAVNLFSVAGTHSALAARRVTVAAPFYISPAGGNATISFDNSAALISNTAADALNIISFSLPIKLYSGVGGAASIIARTSVTMGGTGDRATTVSNLTLIPETSQTAALLDLSGAAATLPQLKIKATTDTPTTTYTAHVASTDPAGFIKILDGSNARYIPYFQYAESGHGWQ